jgi:hypothetical protein
VRFEITVVSVVITFVHVKITIHVEIKLCVYKSHSCHSHTCQNYSCVSGNHTLRVKSHFLCGNRTLRVEINLERVQITLGRVEITLVCFGIKFMPVEVILRVEITLCG